jgi:hypothetical protein
MRLAHTEMDSACGLECWHMLLWGVVRLSHISYSCSMTVAKTCSIHMYLNRKRSKHDGFHIEEADSTEAGALSTAAGRGPMTGPLSDVFTKAT